MTAAKQIELAGEARVPAEIRTMGDGILSVIARAAADPNVDIDKLERLLEMQERVLARDAKGAFTAALAAMQLPEIAERGKGHGNIKYALWEDINEEIKPILAEHGFALSFKIRNEGSQVVVTGILSHVGGHSEETELALPTDNSGSKNAVQAVGSSTSYGKRYTAQALLNLTSRGEDDDGRKAGAGPTIAENQVCDLEALIQEVGKDKKRFLAYLRANGCRCGDTLESIPAADYARVVKTLEGYRA